MYKNNKIGVIIAAAGSGSRMGIDTPKQFLQINGEPVLAKTYRAFANSDLVDEIFIVTKSEYIDECRNLLVPHLSVKTLNKLGGIFKGGQSRQESVYKGLLEIQRTDKEITHVLIHDGARPYVSQKIIEDTIIKTVETGAAIACVTPKDTIRSGEGTLDREELKIVQTPQGFNRELITEAHKNAEKCQIERTDDASLVELFGHNIAIVQGDYMNIKITTKEDLKGAMRIGHGYDVHRLAGGRDLILGGVKIPYEMGLLGHSDADVITHALMDALLGAASLGDIGRHFPDTDEKYKGADSIKLLTEVGLMLEAKNITVSNIDVTLMAEKPKIAKYIPLMVSNIAKAIGINENQINIKGTTTEKLGFVGREEGMAAEAVCLVNIL